MVTDHMQDHTFPDFSSIPRLFQVLQASGHPVPTFAMLYSTMYSYILQLTFL